MHRAVNLSEPARNIDESAGSPSTGTFNRMLGLSLEPPEQADPTEVEIPDVDPGSRAADPTAPAAISSLPSPSSPASPMFCAPPPHVARLMVTSGRPTNQSRRRDSAASSRRNSMSSIHSRPSSTCGSAAAGPRSPVTAHPQSKYVAQHLRRASILEDRKARLADRAAHAEKVRLRAALAKASGRHTSCAASEERAAAARQARERNLAEIAAACAEEVKRAKAVAGNIKEQRERDITRMRLQMEERLAEAERRREEMLRSGAPRIHSGSVSGGSGANHGANSAGNATSPAPTGRLRLMSGREREQGLLTSHKAALVEVMPQVQEVKERDSTPIPLTSDMAAVKVQWWWRAMRRKRAVAEFAEMGLSIDGVRSTSFEKVTELLSEERVVVATARVLRICGLREGDAGSVDEMAAIRTFLVSFLILGHPAQILSNKQGKGEEQEQDLVAKARDLLISFETILARLTSFNNHTAPPALVESFSVTYATFYNAFLAWKTRDSDKMIETMIMQFVELDAIWQSVKDSTDNGVQEMYKQSIQDNQVQLLVRIKKLAGPVQAKKMVSDAIREARKARAKKKPAGDTRPRVAVSPEGIDTGSGSSNGGTSSTQTLPMPMSPPATPARSAEKEPAPQTSSTFDKMPHTAGLLPDNRVVVHELAINKEFRIEPNEYRAQQEHLLGPLFQKMRATMPSDDGPSVDNLQQEVHFLLLLEVAEFLRDKLQRLVRPNNRMHAFIAELLDTDIARRQFRAGSFSYEKFFAAMAALVPKLCAPVRDEEVARLVAERLQPSGDGDGLHGNSYVDRLEALMGFVDVMLSDYANYLLQLAAPQILGSAAAYEIKSFANALSSGAHGLAVATACWRASRQKVLNEVARRDPEGIGMSALSPAQAAAQMRGINSRIYNEMLVEVFMRASRSIGLEEMPEMLRLDHQRALEASRTTRRVITAAAVLLQCKNLLKRDVRAPWRTEAVRVLAVLERVEEREMKELQQRQYQDPHAATRISSKKGLATANTVDGIMAALEAGRSMPAATKTHLRALVSKIVSAMTEISSVTPTPSPPASSSTRASPSSSSMSSGSGTEPRDPVLRLLYTRLRGHVLARLTAASASEKVRVTSTAGEKLAGLGLAEFVDKVRETVDMLGRVGAVDREAHGAWWEEVAEGVEREEMVAE